MNAQPCACPPRINLLAHPHLFILFTRPTLSGPTLVISMTRLLRSLLCVAGLAMTPLMSGCEWLGDDDDPFAVAVPFNFTALPSLPIRYPSSELIDGSEAGNDGTRRVPLYVYIPIPEANFFPDSISDLDLVERVEVVSVTVTVDENSLTIPIEAVEVRVGRSGDSWREADVAATTAQLPPGFVGEEVGEAVAANQRSLGEVIADGGAKIGFGTEWLLNEGDLPTGSANMKVEIQFRAIVSATGAIGGLLGN
jgi:hypothetical protein